MSSAVAPFEVDQALLASLPEHEREETAAALARFNKGVERNPLWSVVPHRRQIEYLSIDTAIGAFAGGNRSGKSFAGTLDDIIQAVDAEALPPWLLPFKRYDEFHGRVGTPNLETTLLPVVIPLFRKLCPKDQLKGGSFDDAYSGQARTLTFKNGNTIDFLTYKMDVDAWSGASKHRVRFDEEPAGQYGRDIYEESLMRVADVGGEIRFTLTPLFGLSWTYHELTERGKPRRDDEVTTIAVDMDDNPHLSVEGKRLALGRTSGARRAARKSGRWVHVEGMIYPDFDRARHVVPWRPVPRDQRGNVSVPIFNAIDPGIDHPTAVLWAWLEPVTVQRDGAEVELEKLVVFESFKVRGETVAQIAERIKKVEEDLGIKPRWRVIDPSARNKQHQTGRSTQQDYHDHGIYTMPGQNSRQSGFNRVTEFLKPDDPQLFEILAGNEELADEFEEYRWKPQPRSGELTREEPVKVKDDLLDDLRYLAMARPTLGRRRDEEQPPDDPNEFVRWEQARRVRNHIQRLAGCRRGNRRRHAGVPM